MAPILDLDELELLEAVPIEITGVREGAVWPCPACGERRDLRRSASARVRNRNHPPLERWIRLCLACAGSELRGPRPSDGPASPPSADPALEPWLVDLEQDTVVRRAWGTVDAGPA